MRRSLDTTRQVKWNPAPPSAAGSTRSPCPASKGKRCSGARPVFTLASSGLVRRGGHEIKGSCVKNIGRARRCSSTPSRSPDRIEHGGTRDGARPWSRERQARLRRRISPADRDHDAHEGRGTGDDILRRARASAEIHPAAWLRSSWSRGRRSCGHVPKRRQSLTPGKGAQPSHLQLDLAASPRLQPIDRAL
jgi:hypothetical protein